METSKITVTREDYTTGGTTGSSLGGLSSMLSETSPTGAQVLAPPPMAPMFPTEGTATKSFMEETTSRSYSSSSTSTMLPETVSGSTPMVRIERSIEVDSSPTNTLAPAPTLMYPSETLSTIIPPTTTILPASTTTTQVTEVKTGVSDIQKTGVSDIQSFMGRSSLATLASVPGVRIEQILETLGTPQTTLGHKYRFDISSVTTAPSGLGFESTLGNKLLYAVQGSEFFTEEAKDAVGQAFEFQIISYLDNGLVLIVTRPRTTLSKYVKIYDPNRRYIGKVKKSLLTRKLSLQDPSKQELLSVSPHKGWSSMPIMKAGAEVGMIYRKTIPLASTVPGVVTSSELHENHTYDIAFPPSSDVTSRVLLLAATIFADMLWH